MAPDTHFKLPTTMRALRIDTVRGRLTAFYISALAAALILVGRLIYVLLARALYARIDDGLYALVQIAVTSLPNDLAEGQDVADAARSTAAELSSRQFTGVPSHFQLSRDFRLSVVHLSIRNLQMATDSARWPPVR